MVEASPRSKAPSPACYLASGTDSPSSGEARGGCDDNNDEDGDEALMTAAFAGLRSLKGLLVEQLHRTSTIIYVWQ